MVGFGLFSYSIGCICLNLLSFIYKDADSLIKIIAIFIILAVLPNLVFVEESPMFLYKTGRIADLVLTLERIAEINNVDLSQGYFRKQLGIQEQDLKDLSQERIQMTQTLEYDGPFAIFTSRIYNMRLLALCFQSGTIYTIYYGLTSSIGELGLPSIQLNGILMGCTQMIGYIAVGYFGPILPRVKASKIFMIFEVLGGAFLLWLSLIPQSSTVMVMQSLMSTFWMTSLVSAHMSVLYIQNAENFPTKHRGFACAVILLFGKMCGAFSPALESLTKSMGLHVIVGCSSLALFAFPMTYLLKETLNSSKLI